MINWKQYAPLFVPEEFECKCGCGELVIDPDLLGLLYRARLIAGVPFVVTSGYRCPVHNGRVGGVSGSAHTSGKAVDVRATMMATRLKILEGLLRAGFTRIGIAKDFIHADTDKDKPQGAYLYV